MKALASDTLDGFLARERLPQGFAQGIANVWLPLAAWLIARRRAHYRPILVGLCGPQGSGKSTATAILQALLEQNGVTAAVLSIDDLYLSRAERTRLAASVHPLLATRGPPGTHDMALGRTVLGELLSGAATALPVFDKARDDRRPSAEWLRIATGTDIVLFEGWCVGAVPQTSSALAAPINSLEREVDSDGRWRLFVNQALGQYQDLFGWIDHLIQLRPPGFEQVLSWRQEQEAKLRDKLGASDAVGVMSDEQVARFIQHYERLTRHIIEEMPARADIVIDLDEARQVVGFDGRFPPMKAGHDLAHASHAAPSG